MLMRRSLCLILGALALLAPPALADVIPISDVNADDADGISVLAGQMATVRGVVTVPTGLLSSRNDIYIQDGTGGVNVIQEMTASPVVALGDSVLVTGRVSTANGKRTFIYVSPSGAPGSHIRIVSVGNSPPAPVELTPREVMTGGEAYEGTYAVVRGVTLPFPSQWPAAVSTQDKATTMADADTSCWLWFDLDTDIDGSPKPSGTFDAYGVVVPDIRASGQPGYGIMPPSRADVRSLGSGSGFCDVSPVRVYAGHAADLSFTFAGEGEALTRVSIDMPAGWTFSGQAADVGFDGAGFASAAVVEDSTGAGLVTISGAALAYGSPGTVTLAGVVPPAIAGSGAFTAKTAVNGGTLTAIQRSPSVTVGTLADSGVLLINEVYAYGADSQDRSEFIEIVNPGDESVSLSGWVLTDMDNSGTCGGVNLWEFPASATIAAHDYVIVAKDARRSSSQGFQPVFGFYPDFELYDSTHGDVDHAGTPNLTLATPPNGNLAVAQEIRLLGGTDGTGSLVANTPAYEAVFLYSDRTLASLVDAVEYRDPVFMSSDGCASIEGLGGTDDAWVPGPPPQGYSLGRDVLSTDTDSSINDLYLCSTPTPGTVNIPEDTRIPVAVSAIPVADVYLTLTFSEPVDADDATDLGSYSTTGGLSILNAWLSRDERTVLLKTDPQVADQAYDLTVQGVADIAGNGMAETVLQFLGYYDVLTPIAEIQAYDEMGYSPLWGDTVAIVGFTTVPPGVFQADRTNMYVQDLDDYGINVYSSALMGSPALTGDLVKAGGTVMEYRSIDYNNPSATPPGSTTELANASVAVIARGFDIIEPAVLTCGDVNNERNEGRYLRTSGVVTSVEGFAFFISDGTGEVQVYQNFTSLDFSHFAVGDSVRVTGVLLQYDRTKPYFGGYELAPLYDSDMVEFATHYAGKATISATARVLDVDAGEVVEITVNAPRASTIEVRVFDLKGRSITTLASNLCVGQTRLSWDARDDRGTLVPPGTYICQIQAKERSGGEVTQAAVPVVVGMKLN
jgi:hypothetical protein